MDDDLRPATPTVEELPRCERHGARTRLTCVDCGAPICPKCMTRTDVGLKCERDAAPPAPPPMPPRSRRGLVIAAVVVVAGLVTVLGALLLGGVFRGPAAPEETGPVVGTWSQLPALRSIRGTASAVALPDRRVVVAGGGVGSVPVAATEVFDPGSRTWSAAGDLIQARRGHRAVPLHGGRIFVVGGIGEDGLLASAEVFDPATGEWTPVDSAGGPRLGHTATALPDGTVLVTGGTGEAGPVPDGRQSIRPIASAEVFDPARGTWADVGDMLAPRFEATATLLPDGRVLIAGGLGITGDGLALLTSAELYDPATRTFSRTSSLASGRTNHAAVLLQDDRVLVTGGAGVSTGGGPGAALASAEVYDPIRGSWSEAASLRQAREGHTATLLEDGTVLVAGGETFTQGARRSLASAERYDPERNVWEDAGAMSCPRSEQAAALLPSAVLVVAGDAAFPGQPPMAQSCVDAYQP